jgi:hypothetical protein
MADLSRLPQGSTWRAKKATLYIIGSPVLAEKKVGGVSSPSPEKFNVFVWTEGAELCIASRKGLGLAPVRLASGPFCSARLGESALALVAWDQGWLIAQWLRQVAGHRRRPFGGCRSTEMRQCHSAISRRQALHLRVLEGMDSRLLD